MVFIPTNIDNFKCRRSALFMPASNKRALEKAKTLNTDCIIFDLEDSILEENRSQAHKNLLELFSNHTFKNTETVIRTSQINATGFLTDLKTANECTPNAILLPKISTAKNLQDVAKQTKLNLWAMIETPKALMNLKEICTASDKLKCLVIGPNDLAKETGTANNRLTQTPWIMNIIAAARAYDLSILDGVYNKFKDLDGFKVDCNQAIDMGFDGRTLIHPNQIDIANNAFGPNDSDILKAIKIIDAFTEAKNQTKGAIQIDGEMIERLHLQQAEQLIKLAATLATK